LSRLLASSSESNDIFVLLFWKSQKIANVVPMLQWQFADVLFLFLVSMLTLPLLSQ